MGMPAQLTLSASTGILYWIPDWMQNPFSVGVALIANNAGGTAVVEATLQSIDPNQSNGTTPTSATWFTVATASLTSTITNWTTPVQAMRLNVSSAVATAVFTAQFVQATYGR